MNKSIENSEILFSIVIPIYNAEKVLERTIQSILNQTYKSYELILVDDCSTDGSYSIAEKYEGKYHHIHAMRLPVNSGSAQRPIMNGFNCAKGDFVMVIGNDDVINETYLDNIYNVIANRPSIDIVISQVIVKDSNTGDNVGYYPKDTIDMTTVLSGPEACRLVIPMWNFSANGMAIRKKLIKFIQIENPYTYSNSDEFSSRILLYHAKEVTFSMGAVYTYFLYPTSITHKRSVKLFESLYTDTHLISFTEKYFGESLVAAMCERMLSNMICLYKSYRSCGSYSADEKQKINLIFQDTYAYLRSKKRYLPSIKNQLYLSHWLLFSAICVIMDIKKNNLR